MNLIKIAIDRPIAVISAVLMVILFGLVALAHMWALIAKTAQERIAAGDARAERLEQDLMIGRAYIERAMPETALRRERVAVGAKTLMAVPAESF